MEKDLIKFCENVKVVYKDICEYKDEDGNTSLLNAGSLFCKCEYIRPDERMYKKMLFDKEIDKGMKFDKEKVKTQVMKSMITGKQEDGDTIVNTEIEVYKIWKVSNGLGLVKTYNNKEEALKIVGEINDRFIEVIKGM